MVSCSYIVVVTGGFGHSKGTTICKNMASRRLSTQRSQNADGKIRSHRKFTRSSLSGIQCNVNKADDSIVIKHESRKLLLVVVGKYAVFTGTASACNWDRPNFGIRQTYKIFSTTCLEKNRPIRNEKSLMVDGYLADFFLPGFRKMSCFCKNF